MSFLTVDKPSPKRADELKDKTPRKAEYSEEFARVQHKLEEAGVKIAHMSYGLELDFAEGTDFEIGDSLEKMLRKHALDNSIELTCEPHDADGKIEYTIAHDKPINLPRSVSINIRPVLSIKDNHVYFEVGKLENNVADGSILCHADTKKYNVEGSFDKKDWGAIMKVMGDLGYTLDRKL